MTTWVHSSCQWMSGWEHSTTLPPFCSRVHHRRPANQVLKHSASFLHQTASSQACQSSTDAVGCVLSLYRFSRLTCHQQDSSCLRTVWVGSPQPFGWDWSLWASTSSFSSLACTWCLRCPPMTALTTPRESRSPSMLVNRVLDAISQQVPC